MREGKWPVFCDLSSKLGFKPGFSYFKANDFSIRLLKWLVLCFHIAIDWIVPVQNSYTAALIFNVTVLGDRVFFKEVVKVKWAHKSRVLIQLD